MPPLRLTTLRRLARAPRGLRRVAWVLLSVWVSLCAVPGAASIVQQSVTAALGVDCCPCEDEGGVEDAGDERCDDCMACAHPHVVLATPVSLAFSATYRPVEHPAFLPLSAVGGVRAPPFRPPAS